MPAKTAQKAPQFSSRAVTRPIEAGSTVECAHCGERVKFQAKIRGFQVICNVYTKGVWDRVEHYHDACYSEVGRPYGDPADQSVTSR
jgi:hypothetical protein